jgi:hypothetical protein
MPDVGKTVGLLLATAMFVFSLWMFSRGGDWVAAVFAIGSAAYGIFFFTSGKNKSP